MKFTNSQKKENSLKNFQKKQIKKKEKKEKNIYLQKNMNYLNFKRKMNIFHKIKVLLL